MSSRLRRRGERTRNIVLCALALILAACGTAAAIPAGITLDVKEVPLSQVVLLLTQQSGINIIIADQEKTQRRITAHLNGLPLERVLDYVVTSAGVNYHKTDDGTYVIGGEPKEHEPNLFAWQEPEIAPEPVYYEPAPSRNLRYEVVKLVNSSPSEILRVLGLDSGSIHNSPITTGPGANIDEQFPWKPVSPNRARSHAQAGGAILSPNDVVPPVTDSPDKRTVGAGRTADEYTGAGQTYGRPGGTAGTRQTGTTGAVRPGQAQPQPAQTTGTTGGGGLLPEGIDLVMAYDVDNSIIVRGDDLGIAEFKDLLHMLDIPPKQVEIKAEFVEVSTTAIKSFGIDWSLERLNFAFNTDFAPPGDVLIGIATGNLTADIRAQLRDIGARVVNSPIVSTINNSPATIEIGKTIPFFQSIVQNVGQGQLVTTQQLIQLPVTTYLFVLPRVNGDGSITLYLEPSVQDTGAIVSSGDSVFPETTYQTIRTNRRIMSGETIVVGGIIRKAERNEVKRVPILSDLPIIGGLFKTKSSNLDDRELLIFLTPRIIPERSGGSIGVITP